MNQINEINAWSLYWSEDRLYSCVAQSSDDDQAMLNKVWQNFSQGLAPNSHLLDLATGNGAVVHAVLAVNESLQIDAVDKASIDPQKFLEEKGHLVNVHSETDIFSLSFPPASFDAITSQFGVEYAGLGEASQHVMPYLKMGGRFQFVVHHAQSGIILSSKKKIIELEQLTQPSGVLEVLLEFLTGKVEYSMLEATGQAYLKQDLLRSEAISGQVFAGIELILERIDANMKESLELGVAMNLRVQSELTRLRQLVAAGHTEQAMSSWLEKITAQGLEARFSPLYLDPGESDYLLGWLASGVRSK